MKKATHWLCSSVLILLVLATFGRAVLGGVFYIGDIFQLHLPLRTAYAEALARGTLPLWSSNVMGGYPLLAEGQLGALYPLNLLLHSLLPVPVALNVFVLLHFLWAALGVYAFTRRLRLLPAAGVLSALVYALGGFLVAHLNHVNIVAVASWLPWLFLFVDRLLTGAPGRVRPYGDAALLAITVGMVFLAGHVQIALLSLAAVGAYAIYLLAIRPPQHHLALWLVGAVLAGLALAGAQLLPTLELTALSERAGGLDGSFFTSFSLHPLYLVSLLSPFIRGEVYPELSVELVGYVGLLPLVLAACALLIRRPAKEGIEPEPRRERFFAALGLVALVLSFGRYNPLYLLLARVPLFNLFRVPGRYLYWFAFSAAILAGMGLDVLLRRRSQDTEMVVSAPFWLVVALVGLAITVGAARVPAVETWLGVWRWLPLVLGALSLVWLLWVWLSKAGRGALLSTLALLLVIVDLAAFNAVFNLSYNQAMPLADLQARPRSLDLLQSETGLYRIYTQQRIVPWLSVMRESYYPNLALLHGLPTANGEFPLRLQRYAAYTSDMTASMLNLLGVKHYLIPQILPVDAASEALDLADPFALDPVGQWVLTPVIKFTAMDIESYLTQSADLWNGDPVAVAQVVPVILTEGVEFTLTAGSHTAEWAYDRRDVAASIKHARAPVARSFPARSGYPPEDHPGHTYSAHFRFDFPVLSQAVRIRAMAAPGKLHIERIVLYDEDGQSYVLAHLDGKGDHILVYRSEDVAIYRNNDVLPRLFMAYQARAVASDAETLSILHSREFDPRREVLLASGAAANVATPASGSEEVRLVSYEAQRIAALVESPADGYLVLTDTWYPGWKVSVDGRSTELLRADLIFRAVFLPAGKHEVVFTHQPASFRIGTLITILAALLIVLALLLARRQSATGHW